ncbi:MAG: flippase-like domain-containing protein [Demequinaceae bacterium]|nr:flippase-like domain-containing protein [Demequinaceae bacterium]
MARSAPATEADSSEGVPSVHIVDTPTERAHFASDLIKLALTALGIATILLIGAYASGTSAGITQDIQGFYSVLRRVLVAPVNILEGAVTLIVPVVIILALATRREPRRILEALGALGLGIVAALLSAEGVRHWGAPELVDSLSITANGLTDVVMPAYLAGVAAMLTAAGRRRVFRPISVSWNVLWAAVALVAISGFATFSGVLTTIFIGRAAGLAVRYILGSPTDRAYGDHLVDGIRRAGFEPQRIIRVEAQSEFSGVKIDPACLALARTRQGRVYEMTSVEGHHLFVVALDGDQIAAGSLAKMWRAIRVRGIDTRPTLDLRHVAESTALVSHAARTAGVRTARVLGMAQSRDTMILVYQRPAGCRAFADLSPEETTDAVIDAIWSEVLKAHHAGITHRALTSDSVLVCAEDGDEVPVAWLSSWEMGEVASGGLSKSIDSVQLVAMIAAKVGATRAVESAFRALPEFEVAALAPFLQGVLLPRSTRIETGARGSVLKDVRSIILERLPDAPSDTHPIIRFGLRKVLTLWIGIFVAYIVLTSFNFPEVTASISRASPWWVVTVFALMLLTFVGAALTLIAFSPIKLPFNRVLLAQVAAAYHALYIPAGVGPAVINQSLLVKRKVPRPLAVATVALVQVSGIVVTVAGLLTLGLITGNKGALERLPGKPALIAVGILALVVLLALTFPGIRRWAASKMLPTLRQTWPRLVEVLSQPWRLLLGIAGNLILTGGLVAAFYASLRAFDQQPAIIDITILFLLGNAAGALVPTPGGLGAIEFTLATTLKTTAGVPLAIAGSAVILFRGITYWARIPLGIAADRYLRKKGEI